MKEHRCSITYEVVHNQKYSDKALKLLSPQLKLLHDFPYSPKEQIQIASQIAAKLSIQGVQPKLSVRLNVQQGMFEITEKGGTFIFKPPHHAYDELPENEDLTMKLAEIIGIDVPVHGLISNLDGSFTYFIKRFDRMSKGRKLAVEDFSQLLGYSRDTKYESSMEKVASVIEKHCSFPFLEKIKLFRLVLFNFLVGNEDMHLKNFTLIRRENIVELSPSYDLVNTTIVLKAQEEIALPLRGKKRRLTRSDLVDYFGIERLGLSSETITKQLLQIESALEKWKELIAHSFLTQKLQEQYVALIIERWGRLKKDGEL